ncbi:MAG: hypothetical protein HQL38_19210 [Alphaproteobacteria bacterium]|nr:hypothetical protein [Alphaproteobacteria bacterium]
MTYACRIAAIAAPLTAAGCNTLVYCEQTPTVVEGGFAVVGAPDAWCRYMDGEIVAELPNDLDFWGEEFGVRCRVPRTLAPEAPPWFVAHREACAQVGGKGSASGYGAKRPIFFAGPTPGSIHATKAAPVADPIRKVVVEDTRFEKSITFTGIGGVDYPWNLNKGKDHVIESALDRQTGRVSHKLYHTMGSREPELNWQRATDESANVLDLTNADRQHENCVGRYCDQTRTVGIALAHSALVANAKTGYRIRLSYERGSDSKVVLVTPLEIRKQLEAIEDVARRLGVPVKG